VRLRLRTGFLALSTLFYHVHAALFDITAKNAGDNVCGTYFNHVGELGQIVCIPREVLHLKLVKPLLRFSTRLCHFRRPEPDVSSHTTSETVKLFQGVFYHSKSQNIQFFSFCLLWSPEYTFRFRGSFALHFIWPLLQKLRCFYLCMPWLL
jgi:hypothetical protein